MANFADLIGAFMQNSTGPSSGSRIGSALEQLQRSGFGGLGGGMGGTQPSAPSGVQPGAGPGGLLGSIFDAVQGGLSSAAQSPGQAGGMGAVLGSLLGGSKGAVQGGMLAVLASVAMKALQSAGQSPAAGAGAGAGVPMPMPGSGSAHPWSGGDMPVGMRVPRNTAEQQALETTAQLVLKGMINAAKSDGQISPDEMQRIVSKLQESGADQGMQQWVLQQMQEPLNVQAFAAEIPNQEVAAQVYAASLLTIEVDTDAERQYLQAFARDTDLHPLVVGQIHQTLGVTA